jgi:hypothetical protein
MSQEVNPYLVTSVGLTTSMPYDNEPNQNLMQAKRQQRIMNKEKADLKKSTLWNMPRSRNVAVSENTVKGKHSAHHHHHQNYMYDGR